ncbi:hypothetical protein CHO01_31650 [Cellulomonas hominis]|uniref:Uncharacterized protein n=1 Tax=Cellulomonas hominis TaxID=156981 RepID=A0A511FFL6_9CELL|nr:hypothetical protein [Cellulomonas hominis]MBB5474775.1 hypothetical protein [Cellulomonas hominis]GEL48049.1 hypothetical protein CHO01_31650 [Cellulomonas hominis]
MTSARDLLLAAARRASELTPRARPWAVSFVGALVAVSAPIAVYQLGGPPLLVQVTLLLPAVATLTLLRQGRTWYRWAAVALLAQVVYSEMLTITLLVAFTWVLHRAWFVDPRVWRWHRRAPGLRRTSTSRGGAQ